MYLLIFPESRRNFYGCFEAKKPIVDISGSVSFLTKPYLYCCRDIWIDPVLYIWHPDLFSIGLVLVDGGVLDIYEISKQDIF